MAETWASGCVFEHGQPELDTEPPFSTIGQNLYMVMGAAMNLTDAVQAWYDEKHDFDYDTLKCAPGKPCGHYTQVRCITSLYYKTTNVTGRHRGPKRKLRAGYRAPSLKRTSCCD